MYRFSRRAADYSFQPPVQGKSPYDHAGSAYVAYARALARLPGVTLAFDIADLRDRLPEADASVDLTLCLYSVLSHLPCEALPAIAGEFARVTRGHFITTVRAVGSTPTINVDSLEKARTFRQDHAHDRCTVELSNGAHLEMSSHLFSARELENCFGAAFEIEDLSGLDIFHGRFTPDRRWNPEAIAARDDALAAELARLEETYAHDAHLIDRANHLLLGGEEPDRPTLLTRAAGRAMLPARDLGRQRRWRASRELWFCSFSVLRC